MERRVLTWLLLVVGGCWAEEPLIHGAFTADQWAKLQSDFRPPPPPSRCDKATLIAAQNRDYDCEGAAAFGQQLFFEPKLSGPWLPNQDDPNRYPAAQTSCSTCHASTTASGDPAWYVDLRQSNAVSMGAVIPTPHNTMSLVNVDVPILDEAGNWVPRRHYGWTGQAKLESNEVAECNMPGDVVNKIALPKAMKSDAEIVGRAIRNTPVYLATYFRVFGMNAATDNMSIQQNVEVALGTYMRRLVSLAAPFDAFIEGDDTAISESAKNGFALFVGRAMCAECHRGGMFTDDAFHVTGVEDAGLDGGRNGTGRFYTASLRNIAKTAPYMHKGTQQNLGEVIDFYSRGGGTWGGYTAEGDGPDPLMHPFRLEPGEALDLQAFLVALTGAPVPAELRQDTHYVPQMPSPDPQSCTTTSMQPGLVCNGACIDPVIDRNHCGDCATACSATQVCMGTCYNCSPGMSACGNSCFDFMTDAANCGGCGNACPTNKPICAAGMCRS